MTPKHIDTFIDLELRKRAHALSSFLIESRLEWEKLDSIGGARTHTFMEDYLSLWGRFGDQWSALEKQGILTPPEYKIFDAIREVFGNTAAVLNRKCLSEPEQKASLLSKKDDRQGPQFLHREYYMDGVSPSMKKPEITLRDKDTITIILGQKENERRRQLMRKALEVRKSHIKEYHNLDSCAIDISYEIDRLLSEKAPYPDDSFTISQVENARLNFERDAHQLLDHITKVRELFDGYYTENGIRRAQENGDATSKE